MDGTYMERIPLVLTVNQLADILGVGRNTAYGIVRSGQIPSVRVGRQIRISRGALMDFLNTH
jgi:excisionase family DNA binding protein